MAKGLTSVSLLLDDDQSDVQEVYEIQPERVRGEVLMEIPLGLIRPDPNQPRTEKTEEDLDALWKRIEATNGITKPIDVKPDPENEGRYLIEDGECRWIVYNTRFKRPTIKSRVLGDSRPANEVLLRQLMANIGGIDMSIIDIAQGIQTWMQSFNPEKSTVDAAQAFGWNRTRMIRTLKVLTAPDIIQEHVRSTKLSNYNTISSMINLHKQDASLFERCFEETQQEGFKENLEGYWAKALREAKAPESKAESVASITEERGQNVAASTTESADSTTEHDSDSGADTSTSSESETKAPKKPRSFDAISPKSINVIERDGVAVLQLSYMAGKSELTSEFLLDEAMQTELLTKITNFNKNN